jgi:hypothetical protein
MILQQFYSLDNEDLTFMKMFVATESLSDMIEFHREYAEWEKRKK